MGTQATAQQRVPVLDGWRGIAIIMVLLTHYQLAVIGHLFWNIPAFELGQHGVTIFFVLSGYLITSKLVADDRPRLADFYVQRFFRLMPAAWTYLAFLGLLTLLTPLKVMGTDLWGCLAFFRNYLGETPANSLTLHFWSLSLEEQFYLVWPPLLILIGRRRGLLAAGIGAAAVATYKLAFWSWYSADLRFIRTEVRADALLVGCILALVLQAAQVRRWFEAWGQKLFPIFVVTLVADAAHYHGPTPFHESLIVALAIGTTIVRPGRFVGRLLSIEWLRTTGIVSYSLYLWQGLFLRSYWGAFGPILLVAASLGSWVFIEQPLIKLGRRIVKAQKKPAECIQNLHQRAPNREEQQPIAAEG
jgi:peptidoglycan/LPS O-acetylase OafA/YrhL